jgi:hypothetical protein
MNGIKLKLEFPNRLYQMGNVVEAAKRTEGVNMEGEKLRIYLVKERHGSADPYSSTSITD